MQMESTAELTPGEGAVLLWRLALNPTYLVGQTVTTMTVPTAHDQIEFEGRTFEMIGPPKTFRGIRKGEIHHYELQLKEVV